jgi:hypothetical protein
MEQLPRRHRRRSARRTSDAVRSPRGRTRSYVRMIIEHVSTFGLSQLEIARGFSEVIGRDRAPLMPGGGGAPGRTPRRAASAFVLFFASAMPMPTPGFRTPRFAGFVCSWRLRSPTLTPLLLRRVPAPRGDDRSSPFGSSLSIVGWRHDRRPAGCPILHLKPWPWAQPACSILQSVPGSDRGRRARRRPCTSSRCRDRAPVAANLHWGSCGLVAS